MTPNPHIFCNAPWYELQIYWDGSLGFCCQESSKMYADIEKTNYNIRDMTIQQWFDSEPMRRARMMMFDSRPNQVCKMCYYEEKHRSSSRRHRSNQKSVIFTKSNFRESFQQSPGFLKFLHSYQTQGKHNGLPIDLHIDLGNYCNLACKMCRPEASSKIASQYIKWGVSAADQFVNTDWTRDRDTWIRVLNELADIPHLRNIHFMGGETLITKKFEDFLDFMISRSRFDLNLSFVSNGTIFDQRIVEKLLKFNQIGIEISIETTTPHNAYQRQGTDTAQVLANIDRYINLCVNEKVTVTLRPAISLLTIGYYDSLIRYAYEHQLIIKSLMVTDPRYLEVCYLPDEVKDLYKNKYLSLIDEYDLGDYDCQADYNESDPTQFKKILKNQILQCLNTLNDTSPADAEMQRQQLVRWCKKWDQLYEYDALMLYPELSEMLLKHGY